MEIPVISCPGSNLWYLLHLHGYSQCKQKHYSHKVTFTVCEFTTLLEIVDKKLTLINKSKHGRTQIEKRHSYIPSQHFSNSKEHESF